MKETGGKVYFHSASGIEEIPDNSVSLVFTSPLFFFLIFISYLYYTSFVATFCSTF